MAYKKSPAQMATGPFQILRSLYTSISPQAHKPTNFPLSSLLTLRNQKASPRKDESTFNPVFSANGPTLVPSLIYLTRSDRG